MSTSCELLKTDRLVATRLTLSDFDAICRLHRDPLVMQTLSADGDIYPDDVTLCGLNLAIEHWRRQGFGFWAFRNKTGGEFIGRGGLKQYEISGRTEIGLAYAVLSEFWNQGFATEMAAASLDVGFEKLGCPSIASWTLPHNRASRRVMQKLGFRFESDIDIAGLPHQFYRLATDDWQRKSTHGD